MSRRAAALAALLVALSVPAAAAAQGGTGRPANDAPKPDAPPGRSPRRPAAAPKPAAPKPAAAGALDVRTEPGGCEVLVDGARRGVTDPGGRLAVSSLRPGDHEVVVRKVAYREQKVTVRVSAGRARPVRVSLRPLGAALSVRAGVEGAEIRVGDRPPALGTTGEVELEPGDYVVRVAKLGYRTEERSVTLAAGERKHLDVPLEALAPEDLVDVALEELRAGRAERAAEVSRALHAARPDQPVPNLVLGLALFRLGDVDASVAPLARAVAGGETLVIPATHVHAGGAGCPGALIVTRDGVAFRSSRKSGHDVDLALAGLGATLADGPAPTLRLAPGGGAERARAVAPGYDVTTAKLVDLGRAPKGGGGKKGKGGGREAEAYVFAPAGAEPGAPCPGCPQTMRLAGRLLETLSKR